MSKHAEKKDAEDYGFVNYMECMLPVDEVDGVVVCMPVR